MSSPVRVATLYAAMAPPPPEVPPVDLEAVAAEGYARGFDAGGAAAEARVAPVRDLLTAAAAAYEAATVVDRDTLRGPFIALVTALAEAVIADALRTDPAVMARLVDTALASVVVAAGAAVRVHPDDVSTIPDAVADPAVPRGSVVVDAPGFVIADGLPARLAALLEELL